MNPEAQEVLNQILLKDPESLNRTERDYLRARQSYLKKSQREEYQEILETVEAPEVVQEVSPEKPLHLKTLEEYTYNELLNRAREIGYKGPRLKRPQLITYIGENLTNPL